MKKEIIYDTYTRTLLLLYLRSYLTGLQTYTTRPLTSEVTPLIIFYTREQYHLHYSITNIFAWDKSCRQLEVKSNLLIYPK